MGRAKEFITALGAETPKEALLLLGFQEHPHNYFLLRSGGKDHLVTQAGPGRWLYRVFKYGRLYGPGGELQYQKKGSASEVVADVKKHRTPDWPTGFPERVRI